MRLCAMNASGTVSLEFRDLLVARDRHMKTITREQMARNDLQAILAVVSQPFGVARASIDLLRAAAHNRKSALFESTARTLEEKLNRLRDQAEEWIQRPG